MSAGLSLVRAHFDSFLSDRSEDYERQLAPTYRHLHLPADLGEGPEHARRWREVLFRIYRTWRVEIEDDRDDGRDVIVRLKFFGANPPDASMPRTCASSVVLHYRIEDGRLASCNAVHTAFEAFTDAVRELAPRHRRHNDMGLE